MPLLEEKSDLSRLVPPERGTLNNNNPLPTSTNPQNLAGSVTTPKSVPGTNVTLPSTVAAIEAAQNTEINVTPQRKVLPETPLTPPKLPKTPPKPTP